MKTYYTDRLAIRELDETFAGTVLDYYTRNRSFLEEWEAARPEEFYTYEMQKKSLRAQQELSLTDRGKNFWIFKKEDTSFTKAIGCISFSNIVRSILQSAILGYKLDAGEVNKGYLTEALEKAIEVMFTEHGLHRLEAPIMPKNGPSLKVVQKLGFENEGLSKKYIKVNGIWEDHYRFALVNDHYQN